MTTLDSTTPLRSVADTVGDLTAPTVFRPYRVAPEVHAVPAYLPVPGLGVLPASSFLIDGPEPVLIDAGPGGAADDFARAVESLIDPVDLRWVWLTHTDPDHVGALPWLLEAAPHARFVTTFLAVGKLGMHQPLPMDRCWWANPGDTVPVAERPLLAVRPPSYDAPETTAVFDPRSATLFSADSFGAVLPSTAPTAADVDPAALDDGMLLWATIDAPWVTQVDVDRFARSLQGVRDLAPARVLSSHLPPAEGVTDRLLANLGQVPGRSPWTGPDQAALEAILAQTGA